MRKHLKYGFFVCVLGTAIVLVLLYYGTKNNAGQSDSHTIPPDLSSVPSSPDKVLESVQKEESQVSVEKDSLERLEDQQVEQESQAQSDTTTENHQKIPLKKKKVVLEDGKEIMIFENVPDSWKTETEVYFDEEGKARVTHRK